MKKIFLMVSAVVLAVMLASCGSAPAPVAAVEGVSDADLAVALSTTYFTGVVVDNFTYGDKLPNLDQVLAARTNIQACAADPVFIELQKKGYKIFAVGHGCKFGSNGGNIAMGRARAQQVAYELRAQKVNINAYMGVTSVGKAEMVADVNGGQPEQRRVTFKVAK